MLSAEQLRMAVTVTVKTATRHHTRHPGAIPEDSDTQYDPEMW